MFPLAMQNKIYLIFRSYHGSHRKCVAAIALHLSLLEQRKIPNSIESKIK